MTEAQLAAAFNEWMRRYIETPEDFAREWQAVRRFVAEDETGEPAYGRECAAYVFSLAEQATDLDDEEAV